MEKLIIAANQFDGSFYDGKTNYDELSDDAKHSGNWWYLSGILQEDIGYDKGYIVNIRPDQLEIRNTYPDINLEGEYNVEVLGISEPCVGYFWIDSMNRGRGLVCYKDDIEEIEYAKNCMINRQSHL